MKDEFYKIRHKSSGLFFKPSKDSKDINLSKVGKVYQKKPSLAAYQRQRVRVGFEVVGGSWTKYHDWNRNNEIMVNFDPKEWQIIKFKTTSEEVGW